ncbi:CinA family protein [Piscinibacter sp. XHJ-5]|uniref:CinA family protein n=1 Tax=Piscinibacter sp. XHJ-5 TaxID=3037797 RepID=UPI002452D8BD|nr:CinA family protein [Piscinibacter sp. XHJ-5]
MAVSELDEHTARAVEALAAALRLRGWMMASAESCTGGLIAAACTSIAGSSDWFERGIVSYSNAAKSDLLDVPPQLIDRHGAVSAEVACAMAEGVLARSPAQVGVAVTGIAGPGGATPGKPVGTVWVAVGTRGEAAVPTLLQLEGDRAAVRRQTVVHALALLLPRVQR